MKKLQIILLIVVLLFVSGCAKEGQVVIASGSPQVTIIPSNAVTSAINNQFFFGSNIAKSSYNGIFIFNELIKKDVILRINKLADLKYGSLYELRLDTVGGVTAERLSLGYFYVQEGKIYKIPSSEANLNKLKSSEELPSGSVIVCQNEEIKDSLGKDEKGYHNYILVNGDRREFHAYNTLTETGYYESFTWEKGKGLINYSSGYGSEKDSIQLQLN